MDWLKNILQSLPLDKISDILGEIVIWWSQLVRNVPPADLPMYAYLGGSILVLLLWILVARMMPRPLGGMSWMVLFAVLLAPGTALSDPSVIAPASISVVYAVMMKDFAAAVTNALPILVVLVVGLFIGFVWQLIRGAFDSSLDKARLRTAEDTQANMQLATGNYLAGHTAKQDKQTVTLKKTSTTAAQQPNRGLLTEKPTKISVAQKIVAKAKTAKKSAEDNDIEKSITTDNENKSNK
ncbi:hypothetical protein [uncultured Psychrobacter sp.]|uniref:hypothetical protein n=1 Tax=uncultured Psychrobacter sp. TaxID=259303 RepID=UPI00345984E6